MSTVALTQDNFDQVIAEHDIVVIDFWAEWCGPCKSFASTYDDVAKQYPDVLFAKIDIESESDLAQDFNVRSIPFVMIMREQIVVYAESGVMPASALKDLVEQAKSLDMTDLKRQIAEQQQGG